ncbi:MAG: hypothetical protein AB8B63_19890, partial [Granulosicoccus sp.]
MSVDPFDRHLNELDQKRQFGKYVLKDAKKLADAIVRTTKIYRPSVHNLLGDNSEPSERRNDLRIGLFSRHISIQSEKPDEEGVTAVKDPELVQLCDTRLNNHYKLCVPFSVEKISRVQAGILEKVSALCDSSVDIICLGELGYPSFTFPVELSEHQNRADNNGMRPLPRFTSDELKQLADNERDFREQLQNLADRSNTIILAGTHHNCLNFHNEAIIFFPLIDDSPRIHQKLTAAKSINVGEVIRTPGSNQFPIYTTPLGKIAVLICIDVYDLNMFCRQLHAAKIENNEYHLDIILVPSLTDKSLAKACKDLSYVANCVVIYVNSSSAAEPHANVYVSGRYIDPAEKLEDTTTRVTIDKSTRRNLFDKVNTHLKQ